MWSVIHPKFMPKSPVMNVSGTKIVATNAHQISALVELGFEHHPHRVRSSVDRRQRAVGLLVQPVQIALLPLVAADQRADVQPDLLEDRLLGPDPAPHCREPGNRLLKRRPRHAFRCGARQRRASLSRLSSTSSSASEALTSIASRTE